MAFDLKEIDLVADSERGAWLHIRDPRTGEPLNDGDKPCRLKVMGPHADEVQRVSGEVTRERQKREAARTKYDAKGNIQERGESTPEELLADDVRVWTAATLDWENLAFNGTEEFGYETVADMYTARQWIGKQVQLFMMSHENFMTGRGSD